MHDGTTPLILAARLAVEGMLEDLINSHADVNAVDDLGKPGCGTARGAWPAAPELPQPPLRSSPAAPELPQPPLRSSPAAPELPQPLLCSSPQASPPCTGLPL